MNTQRKGIALHQYVDPVETYGFIQGHKLVKIVKNAADYTEMPSFQINDTEIENFANTQQVSFSNFQVNLSAY